jgi:hypothetical protein
LLRSAESLVGTPRGAGSHAGSVAGSPRIAGSHVGPRIALCTTCRGRSQHIKLTLAKNIADNAHYPNAVFVLLDYDSQDDILSYVHQAHAKDLATGRLVLYSYKNGGGPFLMAHAKNMAMRCGMLEGADILVTLDADNFTGEGFCEFIAQKFAEPGVVPGIFLCPDYLLIKSLPHGASRPARGYAGRLALWARSFLAVGGYDEIYNTWRGEDIDMNFRLQRMGYAMRYIDNKYLNAINHSSEVRFKEYPHAQQYENKAEVDVIRARTETVVNAGKWGLGKVHRNFRAHAVRLDPLPTRVFGIGLHKTGTTSLNAAFKILGMDSFHWGAGEAPMIWHEMAALGRSKTLEQWYALSDLPIPLLYQKLDKTYPGSKFILTVRDEAAWLQSVQRLWSHEYNPTRWVWDVYPFSNQIHTELYGRKDFDAAVFLARYRRHNAEVRAYFKDRPGDLLIMDMSDGWASLCEFLGKPVPDEPYPYKNKSVATVSCVIT